MTVASVPSSGYLAHHFTDVDHFKQAVRKFNVRFTPVVRKVSVQHAILNLADFDVSIAQTFPRLVDMQLVPDCTAIGFGIDGNATIRFNGVDILDPRFVAIGHGGDGFSMVERSGARIATVVFTPEVHDRGWPETRGHFTTILTALPVHHKLRLLVSEILDFAAASPDAFRAPETRAGIRESLLLMIDQVFYLGNPFKPLNTQHLTKAFAIFQKIEAAIAEDIRSPLYSNELAAAVGVSIRTLQDVVLQFRGTSLHRYLRLKRLWLVRRRLLAGHTSVKACALEYGFWHLGDFSRSYRLHFGETPSQTLASSR